MILGGTPYGYPGTLIWPYGTPGANTGYIFSFVHVGMSAGCLAFRHLSIADANSQNAFRQMFCMRPVDAEPR